MEITKVIFEDSNLSTSVCYDRGERFYIGFATNPSKQVSILFPDLTWIKKHFGDTFETLNEGRQNEIKNLKFCIEHNIPMWELSNIVNFDTVDSDGVYRRKEVKKSGIGFVQVFVNGEYVDKVIEYKPYKLSEGGADQFQKNIDEGLHIVCELVAPANYEPVKL